MAAARAAVDAPRNPTGNKKDAVRRGGAERAALRDEVAAGARILLKADVGPSGPVWTDARIAEALEVDVATTERVRKRSGAARGARPRASTPGRGKRTWSCPVADHEPDLQRRRAAGTGARRRSEPAARLVRTNVSVRAPLAKTAKRATAVPKRKSAS